MKTLARCLMLSLLATACSSGGDGGTNNPPPAAVGSVSVSLALPVIEAGNGTAATAVVKDGSGNTLTGRGVSWSSSNTAIATVSGAGAVTGIAPGVVGISATSEGKTGTAQLTVNPPAVATVTVFLANASIAVGAGTQATVVLGDARGGQLSGRQVSWQSTNPAVASVSGSGAVVAIGPGTTTITATSEGVSGGAPLTVTPPPVTQVAIFGTSRVKVGDTYQYTAEARLADNTLVQRPVTWSVVEPGRGTITASGVLTPLLAGALTVRAVVENVSFNGAITAYHWAGTSDGITSIVALPADVLITNKFGTSEYPLLVVGCSSGFFGLFVSTSNFVTHNGFVSYSFDGGTIFSQLWDETDDFSSLFHPGPTNLATKNFANAVAASRLFAFAFTEFNAGAKATVFRVNGMNAAMAPIFTACPSNSLQASRMVDTTSALASMRALLPDIAPLVADREARRVTGGGTSPAPAAALRGTAAVRLPARLSARP